MCDGCTGGPDLSLVVSAAPAELIPVTILTGFLGAGKTSLLARFLKQPEFARTAVIINEFGDIGLDHDLVRANTDARIMLLESGCVCCSLRSDLTDTLRDLFRQRVLLKVPEFERVIVETTGLADPMPIVNALAADPVTAVRYRLDRIVTIVDALNGDAQLDVHAEAVRQVAMADMLILSKTDLASAQAIARLTARLAVLNPGVMVIPTSPDDATPDLLTRPFTHAHGHRPEPQPDGDDGHDHDHTHHHDIGSFSIRFAHDLPWDRVGAALEEVLDTHGDRILRIKGILGIAGEPLPVVIHGVGHMLFAPSSLAAWPDDIRTGRLVFITHGADRAAIEAILARHLG
jgi:G3E family GTPase